MAHPVTGRRLPSRHGHLRAIVLVTGLGLVGLIPAGCSAPATTGQATSPAQAVEAGRPVEMVKALLDDKVTTLPDKRTAWSTTWRACFEPDRPDTTRMEARAVTPEGSGTSLRVLEGNCLALGVASGQGGADAGMVGRDAQLADAGALAYRVRAVHTDGTVSPWSAAIPVGTTKP
jgi:hypothetical protein